MLLSLPPFDCPPGVDPAAVGRLIILSVARRCQSSKQTTAGAKLPLLDNGPNGAGQFINRHARAALHSFETDAEMSIAATSWLPSIASCLITPIFLPVAFCFLALCLLACWMLAVAAPGSSAASASDRAKLDILRLNHALHDLANRLGRALGLSMKEVYLHAMEELGALAAERGRPAAAELRRRQAEYEANRRAASGAVLLLRPEGAISESETPADGAARPGAHRRFDPIASGGGRARTGCAADAVSERLRRGRRAARGDCGRRSPGGRP